MQGFGLLLVGIDAVFGADWISRLPQTGSEEKDVHV